MFFENHANRIDRSSGLWRNDTPDAVIVRISDPERAFCIDGDTVRPVQLRTCRRATVAARPTFAIAGHGRDDARLQVDTANFLIFGVDDINGGSVGRHAHFLRPVESRLRRGAAIA